MNNKDLFGFNDDIYCKHQDSPAFVFYKKGKYQNDQKITPKRAWIFNLETQRIDTVSASKVDCRYNKTSE